MRPEPEHRSGLAKALAGVLVEPLERAVLDGVHELESGAQRGAADDSRDADEPARVRVDLGVVAVFVDERPLIGLAGLLDWRSSGRLSAILRSNFFSGAVGEQLLTPGERRWPIDRLVILGLGPRAEFDDARARELGARCVEIATGLGADDVLIALPSGPIERGLLEAAFDSLLEACSRRRETAALESQANSPSDEPSVDDEEAAADEDASSPGDAEQREAVGGPGEEAQNSSSLGHASEQATPPEQVEASEQPDSRETRELRCWVVADESVVARLRRVRSGPPRAARGSSSSPQGL